MDTSSSCVSNWSTLYLIASFSSSVLLLSFYRNLNLIVQTTTNMITAVKSEMPLSYFPNLNLQRTRALLHFTICGSRGSEHNLHKRSWERRGTTILIGPLIRDLWRNWRSLAEKSITHNPCWSVYYIIISLKFVTQQTPI